MPTEPLAAGIGGVDVYREHCAEHFTGRLVEPAHDAFHGDVSASEIETFQMEPGQWLTQADYDKVAAVVAAAQHWRSCDRVGYHEALAALRHALAALDAEEER